MELYSLCPVFLHDVDLGNITFTLNTSVASVHRRCVRQCSFSETVLVLRQHRTRPASHISSLSWGLWYQSFCVSSPDFCLKPIALYVSVTPFSRLFQHSLKYIAFYRDAGVCVRARVFCVCVLMFVRTNICIHVCVGYVYANKALISSTNKTHRPTSLLQAYINWGMFSKPDKEVIIMLYTLSSFPKSTDWWIRWSNIFRTCGVVCNVDVMWVYCDINFQLHINSRIICISNMCLWEKWGVE